MVALVEAAAVLAVVAAVLVAYRLLRVVWPFVVNTAVGLLVFLLAAALGVGVQLTPVVVLLVAFGGLPAALLVLGLAQLGVLFEPALLAWG